jgi:Putative DNA-binding domain
MARDLFVIPLEELKFEDIADLVNIPAEEGIRLEFKGNLPTSDGQPDRWMRDQSRIGRVARDDIAKEVVAFANAYGGAIVIGIEETDDHPKRAKELASPQIPRVVDCAEQLDRALRSIIDPPLPMLEVRGIASGASGEGAILIRVGASPSAPHGFGAPPASYVRHGSQSVPLSMRELQSMFFERRTRLERIEVRRREFSDAAQELWARRSAGRLPKISGQGGFAPNFPVILFRCSLVPTDDFGIDNFPDRFLAQKNSQSPKPAIPGGPRALVELPEFTQRWVRRYRAVEHIGNVGDRLYWCASFGADGSINQVSIVAATGPGLVPVAPAWYPKVILQGMVLAEWLRRWAARPDVEYALDGEFKNDGADIVTNADFDEHTVVSWPRASIGPYSVGSRATFQSTFDVIERELWDAFGFKRLSPLKFDLVEVFRSIGL